MDQDNVSFKLDLLYHIEIRSMKLYNSSLTFGKDKQKSKNVVHGKNDATSVESFESIFTINFVEIESCFDSLDLFLLESYLCNPNKKE